MIPVGAIAAAAILAARLARRGAPAPVRPARARWMILLWAVIAPLWMLLSFAVLLGGFHAAAGGAVGVTLLLLLPFFFPWAVARHLFIAAGMPRAAYWTVAIFPDWAWMRDPRGGAVLAGAWALLRQRRPDERLADWLENRLAAEKKHRLAGAGVVASGLVAAARGDLEGARSLLSSVRHVDPRATPRAAQRIAIDWLVADAAGRGDWKAVAAHGTQPGAGSSARLCAALAARLLGAPDAPSPTRIWLRWAIASNRIATLNLVRRALGAEPAAVTEEKVPEAPPEDPRASRWDRALSAHARVLARPDAVAQEALADLGLAWDGALGDQAERKDVAGRAFVLGLSGADGAVARVAQAAQEDIAAIARASGIRLDALRAAGGIAARAAERLRDELLHEVELASGALRDRVTDKRALPPIAEWREWIAIRAEYERAIEIGGAELQRLLFSRVKNDVWSQAYWLSSERSERTVAHAIYVWLLAEAKAVGDTRAIEPLTGNVAATAASDPMR